MWLVALSIFLFGSSMCAAAWSVESLILFRIIQGIGSGMLMPIMQTVVIKNVGHEKSKAAMAAIAVPAVIAPILGPLIGGLLVHEVGWRWVFIINAPVCLLALALAYKMLADHCGRSPAKLDLCGLLFLLQA